MESVVKIDLIRVLKERYRISRVLNVHVRVRVIRSNETHVIFGRDRDMLHQLEVQDDDSVDPF